MATLKAGSIDDLADSMAAAIDAAFDEEWNKANPDGPALGQEGERDRQVLFAAVAKGGSTLRASCVPRHSWLASKTRRTGHARLQSRCKIR